MGTKAVVSPPDVPLGKIKCFGSFGAKYEVGKPLRAIGNGDWMIAIKLVDTGEDTEYRYTHLVDDPEAR
jgi:hypothetical protein